MTAIAQGQGKLQIDNAGGTLTDISGSVVDFSLDTDQTVSTHFVINNKWARTTEGGRTWSVTVKILFETGTAAYSLFRDWYFSASPGLRTVQIDTPDDQSGSQRYSGEVRLERLPALARAVGGSGEPITLDVQLRGSDALTSSTIA